MTTRKRAERERVSRINSAGVHLLDALSAMVAAYPDVLSGDQKIAHTLAVMAIKSTDDGV